jgi:hypothetical protein
MTPSSLASPDIDRGRKRFWIPCVMACITCMVNWVARGTRMKSDATVRRMMIILLFQRVWSLLSRAFCRFFSLPLCDPLPVLFFAVLDEPADASDEDKYDNELG